MQALVVDRGAPSRLRLGEVPDPVPAGDEAVIVVRAVARNFDDVNSVMTGLLDDGDVLGSRVATFGFDGGWATRRAVPAREPAVIPEDVEPGAASTLPAAGVSALRAVRRLGAVAGRRVRITGASG